MSLSLAGRQFRLFHADADVLVARRRFLLVQVSVDVDRAGRHLDEGHVRQQQRRPAGGVQRHRPPFDRERPHLVDGVDVVIADDEPLRSRCRAASALVVRQRLAVDADVARQMVVSFSVTWSYQACIIARSASAAVRNGRPKALCEASCPRARCDHTQVTASVAVHAAAVSHPTPRMSVCAWRGFTIRVPRRYQ